jgi:hypothetical protein
MLFLVAQRAANESATGVSWETAAISAGAAVVAAFIAAFFAGRRLKTELASAQDRLHAELKDAGARLKVQLDGEHARLRDQFAQDRSLAQWEQRRQREDELRGVLECAAVRYTEALETLDRIGEIKRIPAVDERDAFLAALREHLSQLTQIRDRLAIRLGNDAPLVNLFQDCVNIIQNSEEIVDRVVPEQPMDPQDFADLHTFHREGLDARSEFYDGASQRIGPDAPRPD